MSIITRTCWATGLPWNPARPEGEYRVRSPGPGPTLQGSLPRADCKPGKRAKLQRTQTESICIFIWHGTGSSPTAAECNSVQTFWDLEKRSTPETTNSHVVGLTMEGYLPGPKSETQTVYALVVVRTASSQGHVKEIIRHLQTTRRHEAFRGSNKRSQSTLCSSYSFSCYSCSCCSSSSSSSSCHSSSSSSSDSYAYLAWPLQVALEGSSQIASVGRFGGFGYPPLKLECGCGDTIVTV